MKLIPLNTVVPANPVTETGPVTREMVQERARELAFLEGRAPSDVVQGDYEQAKLELTGKSEKEQQDAILDALPEAKRWDPVPGSQNKQAPESPSEDEDAEGRSETEQLVDKGVEAAEKDRMLQADRIAAKI